MNIYTKTKHKMFTQIGCIIGLLCLLICPVLNVQGQESSQQNAGSGADESGQQVALPIGSATGVQCQNRLFYLDKDNDGAGDKNDSGTFARWCEGDPPPQTIGPDGNIYTLVSNQNDCNDSNPNIQSPVLWYPDVDNDGNGDKDQAGVLSCEPIANHSTNKLDCDDNNPNIKKLTTYYKDGDRDGYGNRNSLFNIIRCLAEAPTGYSEIGGDYNDDNPLIINLPTGEPFCQGQAERKVYVDKDGDGYGAGAGYYTCVVPDTGYAVRNGDCNDNDPEVNLMTWYRDKDGDGFGDPNDPLYSTDISGSVESALNPSLQKGCSPPTGYVDNNLDNCLDEKGPHNGCLVGENPNENLNSIRQLNFDIAGNLVSASKSYFDELGKSTQIQSYDIKNGKIWAEQTLYDHQGRAALQTLPAPARSQILFEYKNDFIKKTNGDTFTSTDFENTPENPSLIGKQSNSLGWYYSDNNTTEPYQDVTQRPYSSTIYSELIPGSVLKTIGGNKINGQWKNGYTFSMPIGQELSSVAAFGTTWNNNTKVIKTVVRDVHGVENVIFTDTDGNTLATARSGNEEGNTTKRDVDVYIQEQGYVDIHIPKGMIAIKLYGNSGIAIDIYNLVTEKKVSNIGTLPNGFYRVAVRNIQTYTPGTIRVQYQENYYDYNLNYYDKSGRLVASKQALDHEKLESIFKYNALGQLEYTKSPDEGEAWFKYRDDGQIRFSQNSKQKIAGEFSYTNYDYRARPIESGVLIRNDFAIANPNATLPSGTRKEQQFTTYDAISNDDIAALPNNYKNPSFLAGNVAKTRNDNTTTYYSYDIYGRVQWVAQNIKGLGVKTIDYEYDPVSNQVSKVIYQKGVTDQFIHRYTYDADDYNLTKVETSTNNSNFIEHAEYEYYESGALKRLNLAQGLQGIDYVYNLQGALKSINHPNLTATSDPGGDATDLFGMNLHYYQGDYQRNTVKPIPSIITGINQYNGNIKAITWNSKGQNNNSPDSYYYKYNKNNWLQGASFNQPIGGTNPNINPTETRSQPITTSEAVQATQSIDLTPGFSIIATPSLTFAATIDNSGSDIDSNGDYNVSGITYDANGNIKTLNRNKNMANGSNAMDQLSYTYKTDKPNQLLRVDDVVGNMADAGDIGDQNGNNYEYNSIGQLIKNNQENITYLYNASGLVTEVKKGAQPLVKFFYNDKNHRVRKESYNPSNGNLMYTEHYVRDVAGTTMAIYRNGQVVENTVYGTGRLGVRKSDNTFVYQLTDHLGNVRGVIARNNGTALLVATDYYPFGMPMPGRDLKGDYRYAYQGQEVDPETGKEAFELRLWDARIGRWLTTDPYGQFSSPYLGMHNNPISAIDADGGWSTWIAAAWAWLNGSHGGNIVSNKDAIDPNKRYGIVQSLENEAGFKYSYSNDGYRLNNLSDWDKKVLPSVLKNYQIGNGQLRSRLISAQQSIWKSAASEVMQERVGSVYQAGADYGMLGSGIASGIPLGVSKIGNSSKFLFWGKNSSGHLIKRVSVLGFDVSPQVAQKMVPELKVVANLLLNKANPLLTRVGRWHGHKNAIMYITDGKMLVTEANGKFITIINKTSNNWYQLAKPLLR